MTKADDNLGLFMAVPAEYGERYREHVLEQYKLYVEMADRISSRRHSTNTYFLSANTLLVAAAGFLSQAHQADGRLAIAWQSAVPIAGIVLCVVWYYLIKSYGQLNAGKFKVVHAFEQALPCAPYDAEWKALGEGKDRRLYWPFTHIETAVPWVFAGLYLLLLILTFPWGRLI